MSLVIKLCQSIAKRLPVRHILKTDVVSGHDVNKADVYLSRHYIYPRIDPMHRRDLPPPPWAIHLHHFNRSDADPELHNHPWEWGFSLILTGGYRETRKIDRGIMGYGIVENDFLPWSINFIRHNDFHRVELLDEKNGCWTLFIVGKRVQDWGFLNLFTKQFTNWEEFIAAKHPPAVFKERADA